jgi:hypothetical protein
MTLRATSFCLLMLAIGGCGGAGSTGSTLPQEAPTPENLYPLGQGYAWSYDVDTGTGLNSLYIARVVSVTGNRFEVTTGGEPTFYERRPEGIFRPASQTWLIKSPIEVGEEWPSDAGRTARIASVTASVDVPEGHFDHCVEIVESGNDDGRSIHTTYCQNVGPVLVDSTQEIQITGRTLHVVAKLRGHSFGEAVESPDEVDAPNQ